MKKLFVFSLLALFLCLFTGPGLLRCGLKRMASHQLKQRLKTELPDASLTRFSEQELKAAQWRSPKEFFLNGRLYDVVRIHTLEGLRYFGCIEDHYELRLERKANAFAAQLLGLPGTPQGKLLAELLDWLHGIYFERPALFMAFFSEAGTRVRFSGPAGFYLHPYLECIVPPPEFGC